MKFQSRKDLVSSVLVFGIVILFLWMALDLWSDPNPKNEDMWGLFVLFATTILLLWIYFGTNYELTKKELKYKSGPLRGKIEIAQIREIIRNKTLWCGIKPATAGKGLIVKYNKYDEIYISPKTNDSFIEKLLQLNPKIEIIEIEKRLEK